MQFDLTFTKPAIVTGFSGLGATQGFRLLHDILGGDFNIAVYRNTVNDFASATRMLVQKETGLVTVVGGLAAGTYFFWLTRQHPSGAESDPTSTSVAVNIDSAGGGTIADGSITPAKLSTAVAPMLLNGGGKGILINGNQYTTSRANVTGNAGIQSGFSNSNGGAVNTYNTWQDVCSMTNVRSTVAVGFAVKAWVRGIWDVPVTMPTGSNYLECMTRIVVLNQQNMEVFSFPGTHAYAFRGMFAISQGIMHYDIPAGTQINGTNVGLVLSPNITYTVKLQAGKFRNGSEAINFRTDAHMLDGSFVPFS